MLFDIKLQANFWNESPCILIKVNNKLIVEIKDFIDNQERNIKFDAETNDKNQLVVKRINKSAKDTVVKNSKVIKDSLITITDITIDKISIKPLLHKGQFFSKISRTMAFPTKRARNSPSNYVRILYDITSQR